MNGDGASLTPAYGQKLLLTPQEAAAALGISERTLWHYTDKRGLIARELPQAQGNGERTVRRYAVEDLRAWISSLPTTLPAEPTSV
jgi:hypothetical protein